MGNKRKALFTVIILVCLSVLFLCVVFFAHELQPSREPSTPPAQEVPVVAPVFPAPKSPAPTIQEPVRASPPAVEISAPEPPTPVVEPSTPSTPSAVEIPVAPSTPTAREELKKKIADAKKKLDEANKTLDEIDFGE